MLHYTICYYTYRGISMIYRFVFCPLSSNLISIISSSRIYLHAHSPAATVCIPTTLIKEERRGNSWHEKRPKSWSKTWGYSRGDNLEIFTLNVVLFYSLISVSLHSSNNASSKSTETSTSSRRCPERSEIVSDSFKEIQR